MPSIDRYMETDIFSLKRDEERGYRFGLITEYRPIPDPSTIPTDRDSVSPNAGNRFAGDCFVDAKS